MRHVLTVDVDMLVGAVCRRLTTHGVRVPQWAVRDLVQRRLGERQTTPGTPLRLTPADTAWHVEHLFIDLVAGRDRPASDDDLPAVVSHAVVAQLVVALGAVVHGAAINLDGDRLALLGVLSDASSCLAALGAASQAAHGNGDAVVLVDGATVRAARGALTTALGHFDTGAWASVGGLIDAANLTLVLRAPAATLVAPAPPG